VIFSFGYQGAQVAQLAALAEQLRAVVIDVRGNPSSRKPGWARSALERVLGDRYQWRGDYLGNRPGRPTTPAGLDGLASFYGGGLGRLAAFAGPAKGRENAILLCLEEAPGECHRHHLIARPLGARGVVVRHVYQTEVVDAADLQAALEAPGDADYPFTPLEDVIAELG
jgi:uncharacterized protein (DUF488 family)